MAEVKELSLPKDRLQSMYRTMFRIRGFEEKIRELHNAGLLPKTSFHLTVGQEAVATGVCHALRQKDLVLTTYRGHSHYLAKGGDMRELMAELFGKSTGCCKGKAGTEHPTSVKHGLMSAIAIVGSQVPIAAGLGLASKLKATNQVVVCFFGDGAVNTGAFHEGMNLAAIWKAPVVYVCENNLYAMSTPAAKSTLVEDLATKAKAYGIPGIVEDGMDVLRVYETAKQAIDGARKGEGPTFLEYKTYRYYGHSTRSDAPRRSEDEMQKWKTRDPILRFKETLISCHIFAESEMNKMESDLRLEIEDAVKFANESPIPASAVAFEDLWD